MSMYTVVYVLIQPSEHRVRCSGIFMSSIICSLEVYFLAVNKAVCMCGGCACAVYVVFRFLCMCVLCECVRICIVCVCVFNSNSYVIRHLSYIDQIVVFILQSTPMHSLSK